MFAKRLIHLTFISLILGALMLSSPMQVNAQGLTLCGEVKDYESNGWLRRGFFTEQEVMDLYQADLNDGFYRLYDVVISPVDGPVYNGIPVTKQITSFSSYKTINGFQDCAEAPTQKPPTSVPPTRTPNPPTFTPVPPTATPLPTWTPIPPTSTPIPPTNTHLPPPTNTDVPPTSTPIPVILDSSTPSASTPKLSIIDVQTNPVSINQYERTFLQIKINTGGTGLPDNYTYWDSFSYSGEVVIKSSDGQMVDKVTFIKGDNAYFLSTSSPSEVLINARVKFNEAVQDGTMEVFVYTNDEPRQTLVYTLPINVSNQDLEIRQCASVIVDKLAVGLPISDQANAVIAANKFSSEITSCKDMSCATKLIVDYVQDVAVESIYKDPGGLLVAVKDAVQDQDSLKICKKPVLWLSSIFDEAIRSGIPINMRAVHSPALLMVKSLSGERTGFLDSNSPITEIKKSIAFTDKKSQYVYFPAQDTTTQLTGIGQGVMTIDVLNVQQGQVIDTSYINIPVNPQTVAQVNSNASSNEIVATNGNDVQKMMPDYKVVRDIPQNTQNSQSSNLFRVFSGISIVLCFCTILIGILMVFFAILIRKRRNRHQ